MTSRLISFQIRFARFQLAAMTTFLSVQRSEAFRFLARLDSIVSAPLSRFFQLAAGAIGFAGASQALTGATTFTTSPTSPATAKVGESFSLAFTVTGTPAPVSSWEVSGTLPPGLTIPGLNGSTLNTNIGKITGTPTQAGNYKITVQPYKGLDLTDKTNGVQYPIEINVESSLPPLDTTFVANPSAAVAGRVSQPIDISFSIQGMDAHSWKVTGTLPSGTQLTGPANEQLSGQTLNAASGKISGSPTESGTFTLTLRAYEQTNLGPRADTKTYELSLQIADLTAYESWKLSEFGSIDAPDNGDPDADTLPNLLEYLFLLDPNQGNASLPVTTTTVANSSGLPIRITFDRDTSRTGAILELQAATALAGPWTVLATSVDGAPFSGDIQVTETPTGNDGITHVDIQNLGTTEPVRYFRFSTRVSAN